MHCAHIHGVFPLGLLVVFLTAAVETEPEIRGRVLPEPAARVLQEIMATTGVASVRVTSTERTPREQAQAMYGFIRRHGAQAAYQLYGPEGDAVIRRYEACRTPREEACLEAMGAEVRRQLPKAHAGGRLMHTNPTHFVFDVAIRSVAPARRAAFERAARRHPRIARFLGPRDGEKGAFHIEIPKRRRDAPTGQ